LLSGLDGQTFVNLTLGEAVCYKFPFTTCAAAATVWHRDKWRAPFLKSGGYQRYG
jgi:hypothetical protein